jgi:hypothetical protein
MFTSCVLLLVFAFLFVTIVLPFGCTAAASRLIAELRAAFFSSTPSAVFDSAEDRESERLFWLRVWGGISAAAFFVLLIHSGVITRNHPHSVASLVSHAILSMAASGALVVAVLAFGSFLPGVRAQTFLSRFGFRALWVVDARVPARELREKLASRLRQSSRLSIIDVAGHELLGKGQGPAGGLLYDALDAVPSTPVQLLLLQPAAQAPDPEQRKATVFQSVLAKMGVSPQTYANRLRATLTAVAALNEKRAPEARIQVRFYCEKPSVRAIIFDDSLLVSPWVPRETSSASPFLEVARDAAEASFYSAFRFHFARLWATAVNGKGAAARVYRAKTLSTVVLKRAAVPAAG